jgi:hypothetical protein
VSRNNPDVTAKNWFELNTEAGVERKLTALWNVVPWYLGDHSRIRAANANDVRQGLSYLLRLIGMLAQLRVADFVGRAAGRVRGEVAAGYPDLKIVELPHPSPTFINRSPRNRQAVLDGLIRIRSFLDEGRNSDST